MKNKLIPPILIGVLGLALAARANTITPTTTGFTPGVSIVYSADLTSGEIQAGDGFTIFDIGGFTGFGAIPAGWTSLATLSGPATFGTPLGIDDPALMNVTFTYNGASLEMGIGLLPLGSFTVLTTGTFTVTDDWVSRDHLLGQQGVIDGTLGPGDKGQILVTRVGQITVPDGGSSVLLLGAALCTMALFRRRFVA
jgi:hypothetical protein